MNSVNTLLKLSGYKAMGCQLLLLAVVSLLVAISLKTACAWSLLVGGLTYMIPNRLFIARVTRYADVRRAKSFMAAFFVGEWLKLLMSGGLFVGVAIYLPVQPLWLVGGFAVAVIAFWVSAVATLHAGAGQQGVA